MASIIEEILTRISETVISLPDNQIFIGLVFTGLVSFLLYLMRNIPRGIFKIIKNNACLQITFPRYTSSFVLKYARSLPTVIGPKSLDVRIEPSEGQMLGEGRHIKKYKGVIIYINVEIKYSDMSGERYIESNIVFFTRKLNIADEFMDDVYRFNWQGDIEIYVSEGCSWRLHKVADMRDENTLFFSDNLWKDLITDVDKWKNSKSLYKKRGIPYSRTYLFHGKPGTGKSSTVIPLSAYVGHSIYYLDPSQVHNNNNLTELLSRVDSNSIILIEDIDVSFNMTMDRESPKKKELPVTQNSEHSNGITLSGLLNCLDGIISCEDVVFVFTTNHPEKLDEALMRAGRIDRKFEFLTLDEKTLKKMCSFHGLNVQNEDIKSWLPLSQAEAQEKILGKL